MMINGLNHPSDLFVFSCSNYICCPLYMNFFIVPVLTKCYRIFSLKNIQSTSDFGIFRVYCHDISSMKVRKNCLHYKILLQFVVFFTKRRIYFNFHKIQALEM